MNAGTTETARVKDESDEILPREFIVIENQGDDGPEYGQHDANDDNQPEELNTFGFAQNFCEPFFKLWKTTKRRICIILKILKNTNNPLSILGYRNSCI